MALSFKIENFTKLPDGGPLGITISGGREIDIGRDSFLDWTLPDPDFYISGKHCEVRYRDGAYWLHDVSLNGTFLNGAATRLPEPHRLRNGDRLGIGPYIIAVSLDEDAAPAPSPVTSGARPSAATQNFWDFDGDVPPPVPRADLRPAKSRADTADFLDWAMEPPPPARDEPARTPEAFPWPDDDVNAAWVPPPPEPPVAPAPPSAPHPERPIWGFDARAESAPPAQAAGPSGSAFAGAGTPGEGDRGIAGPSAGVTPRPGGRSASASDVIGRFAAAAGLPPHAIATGDPEELAETLGMLIRIVVEEMQKFLQARRYTKFTFRCGDPTLIGPHSNNPLKFALTEQDALQQMFGRPNPAYLDAASALREGFADLERHHVDTIAAMQGAIRMLIGNLDPREIERAQGSGRGVSAILGSRKAKLWDTYVDLWRTKTGSYDDGLFGAYMDYFAECYDRNVAERT